MSLPRSYSPNYFTIGDILATQERIPCKFLTNVPKMGTLNPSAFEKDLSVGTHLELPLWLAKEISVGHRPVVAPDLPRALKEAHREVLKADAGAVNLHKCNAHFYELGAQVKHFDRKGEVHQVLLETFLARFKQIMDLANNAKPDVRVQQKIETLDALEKKLFRDALAARVKLDSWLVDGGSTIQAADMVISHKKRKRIELEDLPGKGS